MQDRFLLTKQLIALINQAGDYSHVASHRTCILCEKWDEIKAHAAKLELVLNGKEDDTGDDRGYVDDVIIPAG